VGRAAASNRRARVGPFVGAGPPTADSGPAAPTAACQPAPPRRSSTPLP